MRHGWFRENWRHALAARGVKTSRYAYASRGPLISNHEIYRIEAKTGKRIGSLQEQEIQRHVNEIRNQPRMSMADKVQPQQDKSKMDWFEPIRGPEEKSDIGKEIKQNHVNEKKQEILTRMTMNGIPKEEQTRVMDHYGNPVISNFMSGKIGEHEFNTELESKVEHNLNGTMKPEDQDKFHHDNGEHGAFNFIEKAQNSKGW